MNRQQAMKLLGITQEDDEREIKRKYHKMISRFHPDSLNEAGEAHIQRAQEINEAYRILSQSDSREMQNVYGTETHGTEAHGTDNHRSGKRAYSQAGASRVGKEGSIRRKPYH